jgi:hypothetical protein
MKLFITRCTAFLTVLTLCRKVPRSYCGTRDTRVPKLQLSIIRISEAYFHRQCDRNAATVAALTAAAVSILKSC